MKLAEALQERADLGRRIGELDRRLRDNARVQEGLDPPEDPKGLLSELDGCIARLEELTARINRTNCETKVDGVSLTELIAKKDALDLRLRCYRGLVQSARVLADRATRKEIRILSTVDVPKIQKEIDRMAKERRLTDNALQQANWTADLL